MPVVISFTVETDGKLPTGQTLKDAIVETDLQTNCAPAYYMLNCAHPTHFADVLATHEPWVQRLRGLRANASTRSHAELDAAPDLDAGDPVALGRQYRELRAAAAAVHDPRRLLRHRPPACGADLLCLHGGGAGRWREALSVIAGLVPAIPLKAEDRVPSKRDRRVKPGA